MTASEAKKILSIYRPSIDPIESDVAEALALVETDADLKRWLQQHRIFQARLRDQFRHLPVPTEFKENLLSNRRILRPQFRAWPWLAAAAALVMFGLVVWMLRNDAPNRFGDYQERIVRDTIRQYQMDITTSNLVTINHYFTTNGAPTGYELPLPLSKLPVTGAGVLRWEDHPVSMICFDRGSSNMLFLFVLDRRAVRDAPPAKPTLQKISRFDAASWTTRTNTYILAGSPEPDFIEKYVSPLGPP